MKMPPEYEGREHTWLKHRVLQEYLVAWAHKLASVARQGAVRLWYVDCFAGPWRAKGEDLRDTSIHIGLEALKSAASTWGKQGIVVDLGAVFVEKDAVAFSELQRLVAGQAEPVEAHPLHGTFGTHVPTIQRLIGSDPAFLFVDPTGWKGAAMQYIAPLVASPRRDVLVNVMFNDVNRFKDDPRGFIRSQMREFFGLQEKDIQRGLSEEALMDVYRSQLKRVCGLRFAADLLVPHPVRERTKFRLVVGGHHGEVIRLFRDVERRVIGQEASMVRSDARDRDRFARTGQRSLPFSATAREEKTYSDLRSAGLEQVERLVPEFLRNSEAVPYSDLWPPILEKCHIAEADLKRLLWAMHTRGQIDIPNRTPRERSIGDHHIIRLPNNGVPR